MNFPNADEVYYEHILNNIKESIIKARIKHNDFFDMTISNTRIINYLISKGYIVKEIRYEYKSGSINYGFYGRTCGDGNCFMRIIWGDEQYCMSQLGDFR